MKDYHNQIAGVTQQMHMVSRLTASQRKCLGVLAQPAWPRELAALATLWSACPELVEQYLDVMISMMHEFPQTMTKASATGTGERDDSRVWN